MSDVVARDRRDHSEIGRELDYFISDPIVGKGLPLLTPKGTTLRQTLIRFIETEEQRRGYEYTATPILARDALFQRSGHWQLYRDHMFVLPGENGDLALRPVTCPFQFVLYNRKVHSYRDLPVRYGETSTLFRNEASGALHGLVRVLQFTLSDGHIVCRFDQLRDEFLGAVELIEFVQSALGLTEYRFQLSLRDDSPKYLGSDEAWNEAESMMRQILSSSGRDFAEARGEAAIYGPKLDVQMTNVWGKEDTVFTVQLDFVSADRFEMSYVGSDGAPERPYIVHRSSIGCYERTIGFLLEHYQGTLPYWLAPEQVRVIAIDERSHAAALSLRDALRAADVRASADVSDARLPRKIHAAVEERVPVTAIIGSREAESGLVSLRPLGGGRTDSVERQAFVAACARANADRRASIEVDSTT